MTRIVISTEVLAPRRVTCPVCHLLAAPAVLGAAVCGHCAADPERARSLVEGRSAAAGRRAESLWLQLNRAADVLTSDEASRWRQMRAGLEAVHARAADQATSARVARTQAAIDAGDTRISPALVAVWVGYEGHYWANEAAAVERRQSAVVLAQLALCLEDMQ